MERPFDIGKPLRTPHPVSRVCPKCGLSKNTAVKPAAMVAFTWDRICRVCRTRYTPPTPLWARAIFAVFGLSALIFGAVMVYGTVQGKAHPVFGLLAPIGAMIVGFGCLLKAATK
jgi:hypothetical protein